MKYSTKQERVSALIDAYLAKCKKTAFTVKEVAEWALSTGLYPVPKRGSSDEECLKWERRLSEVARA